MRAGALAAAIAAGAAAVAISALGASADHSTHDRPKTIVYYPGQPQIGPTTIDVGPPGESQGDMTVVTRPVLDRPNGRRIGRTDVKCVMTDVTIPSRPYLECNGLFQLSGPRQDTLTFEGGFRFPDQRTSALAITGGTGRFRNARGEFKRISRTARPRYELTLIGLGAERRR